MLAAEVGEKMSSKPKDGSKIKELEALWRFRLRQAHRYHGDAIEHHRVMADELSKRSSAEPDGSFAVAKAMRAEAWARHELNRITHIYSDLLVRRIMPPQDDDEGLIW